MEDCAGWERILTNFRKPEVDDMQKDDLKDILKECAGCTAEWRRGCVCLLSSFILGISQGGAEENAASSLAHLAGPPSKPRARHCAVAESWVEVTAQGTPGCLCQALFLTCPASCILSSLLLHTPLG